MKRVRKKAKKIKDISYTRILPIKILLINNKRSERAESFDYSNPEPVKRINSCAVDTSTISNESKTQGFPSTKNMKVDSISISEDQDFELASELTDDQANTVSNCSFSVEGDKQSTYTSETQQDDSSWKMGKFHNPSIFCLQNCSTWRLKIRKTHNPFSQENRK